MPKAGGDLAQIRVGDEKMKKNLRDSVELMIISVDVVAVIATIVVVTWCCYSRKYKRNKYGGNIEKVGGYNSKIHGGRSSSSREEKMVCFEGCKGFDKVEELLTASAEMLGKGSVGTTYKVVMEGGDVVVVKRVRMRERRNIKKEIDGFLRDNIGGLRNPNILSLRALSCSKDELLLVYDFLPNGSLYTLLHGNRGPGRTPLDWTTRLKLASGSAQGLAFLHSQKNSKLSHGNLTSSNIIIDHLGNACISDIALNLLLQIPFSPNNAYKAPELTQLNDTANNNYSKKCDVYSFGIILLEILTGKTANVEGEGSLANWVRRVMVQEEWSWELFDFELLRNKEMLGEMVALLHVALLCLALSPSDRPEMSVVHKMVGDIIRVKGCGEGEGQELLINELSSGSCSLSESITLNFTSN